MFCILVCCYVVTADQEIHEFEARKIWEDRRGGSKRVFRELHDKRLPAPGFTIGRDTNNAVCCVLSFRLILDCSYQWLQHIDRMLSAVLQFAIGGE
jgi:hypothetical protein